MENINILQKKYIKGLFKGAVADFKKNWKLLILIQLFLVIAQLVIAGVAESSDMFAFMLALIFNFLSLGAFFVLLKVIDEKEISFSQLWNSVTFKQYITYLFANILVTLMVLGGLILLIVPGIILAVASTYTLYAVLDKKKGITESIQYSFKITKGHRLRIFTTLLVMGLFSLIGILALGVGILVTSLIAALVYVRMYRELATVYEGNTEVNTLSESADSTTEVDSQESSSEGQDDMDKK